VSDQYNKEIDKKKIVINEPIKTAGTHEVTVKLHPKVAATLRVHVASI
jgi:large subunit ribosomal protein L9